MNYKTACLHLNIECSEKITEELLKRQYKTMALKYHPDKNRSEDAVSRFQEIQSSYEYLMSHNDYSFYDDEYSGDETDSEDVPDKKNYKVLLFSFFKNILSTESRNKMFLTILKRITATCEDNALDILRKLDKHILIKLFEIIKKYKDVLHFTEEFIKNIQQLLDEKFKHDECILLNPTLEDLFENNLYKLKLEDSVFIIPLWHHELVYDNSGNDIYVNCNPVLPEHIQIDERNNIIVEVEYFIEDIWKKDVLTCSLTSKQHFYIKRENLKLTSHQKVVFSQQGISKINTKNIFDVTNRGDVIVNIHLLNK